MRPVAFFPRIVHRRFNMLKRVLAASLCGLLCLPFFGARATAISPANLPSCETGSQPVSQQTVKRGIVVQVLNLYHNSLAGAVSPPILAQSRKPSQVLKQLLEQQSKMLDDFDADVGKGRAQLYEWESRSDGLRQAAAERSAQFKIADWQGDELLALATIYQAAEDFPSAVNALRTYLRTDSKSRKAVDAQLSLARVFVEAEQITEAENVLAGMQFVRYSFRDAPFVTAAKLALHKDLAAALRDAGQLERAAKLAKEGFDLAGNRSEGLNESAQRDRVSLAALLIALNERLGRQKEALNFQRQFIADDLKDHPPLQSFYESELAAARLTGQPAPELTAARWLGGAAKSLSDYRGKVVLLDFWAMWCTACAGDFPRLAEFQKKFGGKGFEIISVTRLHGRSDTEEDLAREQEWKSLQNFKGKHRLDHPIAVGKMDDPTNDERYGVAGLPTIVLIDRRGRVRHIKRGAGDYRKLEKRIEKLVNEN